MNQYGTIFLLKPLHTYKSIKLWSVITLLKVMITIGLIAFYGSLLHIPATRPTKNITIFIHGTLMPFLALLNPLKTYTQSIKNKDWYYRCLQALRGDSDLRHDSIILEEGLKKIDPVMLYQLSKLNAKFNPNIVPSRGAYQAIGAYDMIDKLIHKASSRAPTSYYTFGFNGILSHAHRKEASLKLYEEVQKLRTECLKQGYSPIITLCGYSHGGNLALLLAYGELIHKQELKIDNLLLFGTPIQAETAIYAQHPMFGKIYNFYSQGDHIQNNDSFSTSSASSFRTFKELNTAHGLQIASSNMYEIRLLIEQNPVVLGHFSYWFFNKYYDSWTPPSPSHIQVTLNQLSPLPIVVLSPLFIDLCERAPLCNHTNIDINLKSEDKLLEIELFDATTNQQLAKSNNIYNDYHQIKKYTGSTTPIDSSTTLPSVLKNIGAGLHAIIQSIIE